MKLHVWGSFFELGSVVRNYEGAGETMSALRVAAIPNLDSAISFLEWTKHFQDLLTDNLSSQSTLPACPYELVLARMQEAFHSVK